MLQLSMGYNNLYILYIYIIYVLETHSFEWISYHIITFLIYIKNTNKLFVNWDTKVG